MINARARLSWLPLLIGIILAWDHIHADALTPEDALAVLRNSTPLPYPTLAIGAVDPAKKKQALDAYSRQMSAIAAIQLAKPNGAAGALIPFLNYSIESVIPGVSLPPFKENLTTTCKDWPAFGALLSVPDNGPELEKYSLTNSNPTNYRMAAFLVLRYVDAARFKHVAKVMDQEFGNSTPFIKSYITGVEDGKCVFWGVRPFGLKTER